MWIVTTSSNCFRISVDQTPREHMPAPLTALSLIRRMIVEVVHDRLRADDRQLVWAVDEFDDDGSVGLAEGGIMVAGAAQQ